MTELEAVILSIAREAGPCHGFAIAQEVEERLGRRVGIGSLYKALHRLEGRGLLKAYWEDRAEGPQHRGPQRRYYEATLAGATALASHQKGLARGLKLEWRTAQ